MSEMLYIVKITNTCPSGEVTGFKYHCVMESNMKKLLEKHRSSAYPYSDIMVVGVVEDVTDE